MIDHARQCAAQFARLHGLLGCACHALLPLDTESLFFVRGQRRRWSVGAAGAGVGRVPASAAIFRPLCGGAGCFPIRAEILFRSPGTARFLVFTVVCVMVQGFLVFEFVQQRVDLFRRHAAELVQQQAARWCLQPVVDQQRVDGEITGKVPAVATPVLAAGKMGKRAVQRLMGEYELRLIQCQGVDEGFVVVEFSGIGGAGRTPIRVCRNHR